MANSKDVKLVNASITMGFVSKESLDAWNRIKKELVDLSKYSHQHIKAEISHLVQKAILFNEHCKTGEVAKYLSQIEEKLSAID